MRFRATIIGSIFAAGVFGAAAAIPPAKAAEGTAPSQRAPRPSPLPGSMGRGARPKLVQAKLRYDSLLSVNDHCPVRHGSLNPNIRPVYVNRQPVGFC